MTGKISIFIRKYQGQALLYRKRFNKDGNEPFLAPDVFPDSYKDNNHCLVEF